MLIALTAMDNNRHITLIILITLNSKTYASLNSQHQLFFPLNQLADFYLRSKQSKMADITLWKCQNHKCIK